MASLTALKSRSLAKTSVTSLMRSMKTNERILRNESCSACMTLRKNTDALVTDVETSHSTKISGRRGRTGLSLMFTGPPPYSSDARIVLRMSTCARRLRPRCSWPWVFRRRLSCATTRWTAARSCSGPDGSARSSSLSGRAGGSCSVRSICARSSSRRRICSKRRISSRGRPSRRGSSGGRSGWGSERRPSWRRMRCTSTPMTPEPPPWRPNAAMAIRARSRIAPSSPAARAAAICARSSSTSIDPMALGSTPPSSRTSWRTAAASAARKKKRSKTSSKIRRSSGDLASVAASASRKSIGSVQPTSPSASKASSSSLVPSATPSLRSSSPSSSRLAARPLRLEGTQLHPDALGDDVEVGAVLDDDRHRVAERLLVDVVGAEQQQRARPVDRLRDRRRLLEVELADELDDLDELARDALVELGRVQAHDRELVLELRVVQPEVEAAPLERLGELARVVGGQQHHRTRARLDAPQLGDGDLEVREDLQQHGLELLVGLVDLVDEQHDRLLRGDRRHERAGEQELLAEDVVVHVLPAGALALGLDAQQLLAVVPLVERLGLVEPLVALQPHQRAVEVARQRLGELGLADARGALDEHRLAETGGEVGHERGRLAGQVAHRAEPGGDVLDGSGLGRHRVLGGYGAWPSSPSPPSLPRPSSPSWRSACSSRSSATPSGRAGRSSPASRSSSSPPPAWSPGAWPWSPGETPTRARSARTRARRASAISRGSAARSSRRR